MPPKRFKEGQSYWINYASLVQLVSFTQLAPSFALCSVDAYFAKHSFLHQLTQAGLQVITRLRDDAILLYPYLGPQRKWPSRQNGKVCWQSRRQALRFSAYFLPLSC